MSLRSRLLLALAAVSLVALLAADFAVYSSLRSFLYGQIDSSLETAHVPVERLAIDAGGGTDAGRSTSGSATGTGGEAPGSSITPRSPRSTAGGALSEFCSVAAEVLIPGSTVEVLEAGHHPVPGEDCSNTASGGRGAAPAIPAHLTGFGPTGPHEDPTAFLTTPSTAAGGPAFRVRIQKLTGGDLLVLAEPLGPTRSTLERLLAIETLVTIGALALALALGFVLVRAGLRPLRDVERTADRITAGDLQSRVPVAGGRTEVGHVAAALNSMLGRIEEAFGQRDATEAELRASERRLKRFVADASHELRTPIAAVSAYAQLFEKAGDGHEQDRDRIMRGITRESARMGRLVEDLLTLARLDEHRPARRQLVELVGLAAEAVQTARAVGPEWPVTLYAPRPVEVLGDPLQLRQVIDNLLGNVRAHTPPGTASMVSIRAEDPDAILSVLDDGPGIAPEVASQVFERFFRADPSRARATGGAGLGLGIVATIVDAHGGRIDVSAGGEPGPGVPGPAMSGATFTVRLPLVSDEQGPSVEG